MKTAMIARFVLGAAAIFAVGCSAETGQGPGEEVGATSAALTLSTADANPVGRNGVASCVLHDDHIVNGNHVIKDYLITAGGFDSTPVATRRYDLFDPSASATHQWVATGNISASSADDRAFAKMIKDPSDPLSCYLVGGINGSGGVTSTFKVTLTSGTTTVGWSDLSKPLVTGRGKFALETCGSNLIAVGGVSNAAGTTPVTAANSIELFVPASGWIKTTSDHLTTGRFDFAFIKDPAGVDQYLVAGGDSGGTYETSFEVIKTTSCSSATGITVDSFDIPADPMAMPPVPLQQLSHPRVGAVLLPEGHVAKFVVAAGYDPNNTPHLRTDMQAVSVTWSTPAITVDAEAGTLTGTHLPALASYPVSSATGFLLTGGDDGASGASLDTIASNNAQEWVVTIGSGTTGAWSTAQTLGTARVGHAAQYLASAGKVFATEGVSIASGTKTYLTTASDTIAH